MIMFNNIVGWSVHCSGDVRILAGLLLIVVSVGHSRMSHVLQVLTAVTVVCDCFNISVDLVASDIV